MENTAKEYIESDEWAFAYFENSNVDTKYVAKLMEEYHQSKLKDIGVIGDVIESIWVVRCEGVIWHISKDYEGAMEMWNKSQSEYPNKKMTVEQEDL